MNPWWLVLIVPVAAVVGGAIGAYILDRVVLQYLFRR